MKHTSKNNDSKDFDDSNTSDKDDILLIQEKEKINSSDFSTEEIATNEEQSFNEFLGVSNAYYYTGKGAYSLNIKAIVFTILGIIILVSSTLLYINNKSNFNIYIGATIGILLLIIALLQFTYKKN